MSDPDEAFARLIDAMAEAVLDLRWTEDSKDANLSCGMTEAEWDEARSGDKGPTTDEMAEALSTVVNRNHRNDLADYMMDRDGQAQ